MPKKYNWEYRGDFFITKEEVIVIRTLYFEWGEQERRTRLELPYENIEIDDSEKGYHAIDLFDILLHYQFGGKDRRPLDLEFLCYIQFSPEYGIPWQLSTINFVDDMKLDKQKRRLNERFKDTLILLNELDITLDGKPNPNVIKYFERPDDLVYLESLEDYKSLSDNELFNNLRTGLWYKKYGEYEHAVKFLEKGRKIYRAILILFNLQNLYYTENFNKKLETYSEIGVDSENPDEYLEWWFANSKLIKIPIELQLVAEETPSFQIGEIYIKTAEKNIKNKQYKKAINYYSKADRYFREVENFMHLWYRKKKYSKYSSKNIEDAFKIKKSDNKKGWDSFTDEQKNILLYLALEEPLFLPLNIRPFHRNPYLEKNLLLCKSKLQMLKGKTIGKKDKIESRLINLNDSKKKQEKMFGENFEKEFADFFNNIIKGKKVLSDSIKQIDSNVIENDLKKKYPKIFFCLDSYSQNQLTKSVIFEMVVKKENINDFLSSIGTLSRMIEKEAELTIKELIKKYRLNYHVKYHDYKINSLKNLLEKFGVDKLKIDKQEIDNIICDLNRVSYLRSPSAHPVRGGTYDELLELRKILLGDCKEEDGLIYKLIKYRNI